MARCLVFGTSSNPVLWDRIRSHLQPDERGVMESTVFKDGELNPMFRSNIRGQEVFILASRGHHDVNRDVMELKFSVDGARRADAKRIHVVFSHLPYSQNDHRRLGERNAVGVRVILRDLEQAGVNHFMVVEAHSRQITGMCDAPLDALAPRAVMLEPLMARPDVQAALREGRLVIASPDAGGVQRASAYLKKIKGARMAFALKDRKGANETEIWGVVGDVKGCLVVIIDDVINAAGTLCDASGAFIDAGAESVGALAIHPVLAGNAVGRISESKLDWVITSNSIAYPSVIMPPKLLPQICLGKFLAEAIIESVTGGSVSQLSNR